MCAESSWGVKSGAINGFPFFHVEHRCSWQPLASVREATEAKWQWKTNFTNSLS